MSLWHVPILLYLISKLFLTLPCFLALHHLLALDPESTISVRSPGSFVRKWSLENKTWASDTLMAAEAFSAGTARKNIHVF
jgi:hypothetical protein